MSIPVTASSPLYEMAASPYMRTSSIIPPYLTENLPSQV